MRETRVYDIRDLPYDANGELLIEDVSIARLIIPGYVYPVDIGSLCYTQRRRRYKGTSSEKSFLIEVVVNSFQKQRMLFITGYLDYMSTTISLGGSIKSIRSSYAQILFFIHWCDENYKQGLNDLDNCKKSIAGFTNHLMHRVRTSDLNINAAASYQLVAITISTAAFNDQGEIANGLRILRRSISASNVTSPPKKADAVKLIQVYQSIFDQLTLLVIKFKKFPYKLTIEDDIFWFFPNAFPLANHKNKEDYLTSNFFAYNYKNGTINSIEKITKMFNMPSVKPSSHHRYASKIRSTAIDKIEAANSDEFHQRRIYGENLAMESFAMLFSAHTGMNLGQIINIQWVENDEYYVSNERQGFKTIKYRANNKPTSFFITSRFLNEFKKYLKLRKYILDSLNIKKQDYLFFTKTKNQLSPLKMSISTQYHKKINQFFNIKEKITTRQWRSFKSDWLIKNTDIHTTALFLQNSPQTVLKHYIEGSETESATELTNYYSSLKSIVIDQNNTITTNLSIGNCIDYDKPESINIDTLQQPNCQNTNGCLFCSKYGVHADATDIKKLYSYKYYILQTRILSDSDEQFNEINSHVLERIDEILKEIISRKTLPKDEINSIEHDVFTLENLSSFWLRKLELLIQLDLI